MKEQEKTNFSRIEEAIGYIKQTSKLSPAWMK